MAKLGKQKFNILGDHDASRTTFAGTIELYLYYSAEDDIFYFHPEELKKHIPEEEIGWFKNLFSGCRTKRQAVDVVEMLLTREVKETRKLRIEIGMNSSLYTVKNPNYKKSEPGTPMKEWRFEEPEIIDPSLPEYLKKILHRGGVHSGHGLTLNFDRVMELEINGMTRYAVCDSNWKYNRNQLSSHNANLIDWTPASEQFLINTQKMLDDMCQVVLKFFNNGDDVNALIKRMENNSNIKLLE